jgi:XTP/dITP diphosphohydrolase
MEILIGTHNRHKTDEISKILDGLPLKIMDMTGFPEIAEVEEDGETLIENAVKKARHYGEIGRIPTLADDTGLEVEALGGEPGVRSARFAGENCSYDDNNAKLLKMLSQSENGSRSAVFKCVIALFDPATQIILTEEGAVAGVILDSPRGKNGFGYDPLFYLPGLEKTLAELSAEEKNKVSHRAMAVLKMKAKIERLLNDSAGRFLRT